MFPGLLHLMHKCIFPEITLNVHIMHKGPQSLSYLFKKARCLFQLHQNEKEVYLVLHICTTSNSQHHEKKPGRLEPEADAITSHPLHSFPDPSGQSQEIIHFNLIITQFYFGCTDIKWIVSYSRADKAKTGFTLVSPSGIYSWWCQTTLWIPCLANVSRMMSMSRH